VGFEPPTSQLISSFPKQISQSKCAAIEKRTLLFKSHPLHLPNQLLYSAAFLHALLSLKEEKQQEAIYIETRETQVGYRN
jgi:hypothetical protein